MDRGSDSDADAQRQSDARVDTDCDADAECDGRSDPKRECDGAADADPGAYRRSCSQSDPLGLLDCYTAAIADDEWHRSVHCDGCASTGDADAGDDVDAVGDCEDEHDDRGAHRDCDRDSEPHRDARCIGGDV